MILFKLARHLHTEHGIWLKSQSKDVQMILIHLLTFNRTKGLQPNDRLIYNIIRAVADKGIWVKDITTQSNMYFQYHFILLMSFNLTRHQNMVSNSIKLLEKKNLIKPIKSVKFPTKKLYMLSEFEPSSELTGGVWYTGDVLDLEFIEALSIQCFKVNWLMSFHLKDIQGDIR